MAFQNLDCYRLALDFQSFARCGARNGWAACGRSLTRIVQMLTKLIDRQSGSSQMRS